MKSYDFSYIRSAAATTAAAAGSVGRERPYGDARCGALKWAEGHVRRGVLEALLKKWRVESGRI